MTKRKDAGFSVFQRADGRWVLSYQVEPGKWKQHILEATNEKAAHREAHRWLAEQRAGGTLHVGKTIGELWRPWIKLRAASPNLATSTVRDNESHFEHDLAPVFGDVAIAKLDVPKIRDFVRTFREGRSASKVRNVVSTLSAFYEDARAEGWVKSPENVVRHPAVTKELPEPKTVDEVVYLPIENAQRLVLERDVPAYRRVAYCVSCLSGLRPGELQGLKWGDIHLDAEVPYLRVEKAFATKASPTAYAALTAPKTPGSVRSVPLHSAAQAALTWWLKVGWPFFVGREPEATDAVFASVNGAHWRPKSARDIRSDLEACGCPSITPKGTAIDFYACRRSFSTWLADAGVDDAEIGRLLGHVGRSTAAKHYTAAVLRRMASAVALVGFRWQDPSLGSKTSEPHSADLVPPHKETTGDRSESASNQAPALVAQWIEQRFPKPKVVRSNRAGGARKMTKLGELPAAR